MARPGLGLGAASCLCGCVLERPATSVATATATVAYWRWLELSARWSVAPGPDETTLGRPARTPSWRRHSRDKFDAHSLLLSCSKSVSGIRRQRRWLWTSWTPTARRLADGQLAASQLEPAFPSRGSGPTGAKLGAEWWRPRSACRPASEWALL